MNKKYFLFLAALLCMAVGTFGQSDDFGIWTEVNVRKKIFNGFEAFGGGEFRLRNHSRDIERWAASAGVSYKLWHFLKVTGGYSFLYYRHPAETTKKGNYIPEYWSPRHRAIFSLTGRIKWRRMEFSLRERYQYTYRVALSVPKQDENGSPKDNEEIASKSGQVLRSRFQVEYNIPKCRITPYISCECYNSLQDGFATDKIRWTAGGTYKMNKRHALDVCYRYQNKTDSDEVNGHVLGIGYTFKF